MPQVQEGVEGHDTDHNQMAKRTAEWVQEGEEEQDEAKKARLEGDPGTPPGFVYATAPHSTALHFVSIAAACEYNKSLIRGHALYCCCCCCCSSLLLLVKSWGSWGCSATLQPYTAAAKCISVANAATAALLQNRAAVNGKKVGRASTGAMNLLANAAEDNEAYEHQLTQAQLQQLQQHLLQQQLQHQVTLVSFLHVCYCAKLLLFCSLIQFTASHRVDVCKYAKANLTKVVLLYTFVEKARPCQACSDM